MSTRLLRTIARSLLAAMLLAALAPAISRTLANSRSAGDWVEICTSGGIRWVRLQAPEAGRSTPAEQPAQDGLLHAMDHCGHCLLAAERFAPLIPSIPAIDGVSGAHPVPRHVASVATVAPPPLAAARGPPLLC